MTDAPDDKSQYGTAGFVNGVPKAWKPSLAKPVAVVQCIVIKKNGERCKRISVRGLAVCMSHGAALPSNAAQAKAVVEAARMRMLGNADMAIDTLEQLMQPGTAENVRLKASTELLDRVGIRGGFEIDMDVQTTVTDPAAVVRERLARLQQPQELEAVEVHEAEVIEDDPDQPPLF